MNRRSFIKRVGLLGAGYALNESLLFANPDLASTATSFSSFPTVMKALTAQDDEELQRCIQMLQKTHAGTGFMHESFHKDAPKKFTRSWFA